MIRILFLGQKPIGTRCFCALTCHPHCRAVAVVTNLSDKVWWGDIKVADQATGLGLPVLDNADYTTEALLHLIGTSRAEWLLSVNHNRVIAPRVIDAVGGRALNLHLAPLPRYKGYYAANHALLNGDRQFGVTLHWMTAAVDGGDIAAQRDFDILPDETAQTLYAKSEEAGVAVFHDLLDRLGAGGQPERNPMPGFGTYYDRNSLNDLREIRSEDNRDRKARAFWFPPFEPAWEERDGTKTPVPPSSGPV